MARRSLLWPDPRVKPPFGSVEIADGHPLAPDFCFLLNEAAGPLVREMRRSLSGVFSNTSAITRGLSVDGATIHFNGTAGTSIDLSQSGAYDAAYSISPPFSIEVWWNWQAGSKAAYAGPIQNRLSGQPGFQFVDQSGSTSQILPHLVAWNGTTETNFKSATTWVRPFNKKFLWAYDGTTATFCADGIPETVSAGDVGYTPGTATINLGGGYSSIAGDLVKALIYKRVLSSGHAQWLAAEPYAFLRPIIRRRYFVAAGAPSDASLVFRSHHFDHMLVR